MIARTESEFNLFNRMDVARREYESLHGVGSGGDGANERRAWDIPEDDPSHPRVRRMKPDVVNESEKPLTEIEDR